MFDFPDKPKGNNNKALSGRPKLCYCDVWLSAQSDLCLAECIALES